MFNSHSRQRFNQRRHLQLVDHNYRPRFVDVKFRYDQASGQFRVELEQGGECLETRTGKPHAKRDLTLWFESIEGVKPRIPWSRIESGSDWQARVLMREAFFETL